MNAKNDASLIWSILHKMVVVNSRRSKLNKDDNLIYMQCIKALVESTKHMFFKCPLTCLAWAWATHIIHSLAHLPIPLPPKHTHNIQ